MGESHAQDGRPGGTPHRNATILFADLRGFTALTSACPPELLFDLLNRWFASVSELVFRYGGRIDRFMGDAIMAVFFPSGEEDGARRAVACAVEMQHAMDDINRRREAGLPELYLGIGVNTGPVTAGRLGSERFSVDTVIGDEVNLAARIESLALRGQILLSESTYEHCGAFAQTGEPCEVYVKGRREPIRVREVHALPGLGREVPRREARRSPRVPVLLPFSYEVLNEKIVRVGASPGTLLDIGYHGARARVAAPLPLLAEVKLAVDLPFEGWCVTDVYARVVKVEQDGGDVLVGLEFTSLDEKGKERLQLFVQQVMQRTERPAAMRRPDRAERRRLVRETVLLFGLAAAFLQYYFLDVMLQIAALPRVTVYI